MSLHLLGSRYSADMARIAITGATGFVGSNIVELLASRGHEVLGLLRRRAVHELPWPSAVVDFSDVHSLSTALAGCDAVIHCAISNDFHMLLHDRAGAYDAYVGMTSRVAAAAKVVGAHVVYISTDWTMDGLQHLSPETDCGNPVNIYGFLKAMGEQVVRDVSGESGAVCRIGGVMGAHRLLESGPRSQDVGFGYFVVSLVQALQRGDRFAVWGGPFVNECATPSLASEIGAEVERVIALRATGTFHLVGDDAVGRMGLAALVCDVFALDVKLLDRIDAPEDQRFPQAVPVDTSLSNIQTKQRLGLGPTSLRALLEAFRRELESGVLQPLT
jgi:dTDP-4-dehydrorhamnose reductase